MSGREAVASLGAKRSLLLRQRVAAELSGTRQAAGLSVSEVAWRIGVSADRIARAERGEPGTLSIDLAARMAPVVGLQLAVSLHPNGDPARDKAHLALLGRFRARLPRNLKWRTEVPMPIPGDLRAGDACIDLPDTLVLIEAETRVTDLQSVERRANLKQRDLGADRLVLLLADTPNNRRVLALHPELRDRFPLRQRRCVATLARGEDPGGNALIVL